MRRLCPKPPQLPQRFIGLTAGVGAIVVKILDGQEEERASFIAADIPLKRKTQELYNELVVLSSVCALKCFVCALKCFVCAPKNINEHQILL